MNKKLSVVIPAFNESKNLEKGVIEEVCKYLSSQKYSWEVLIVDDGSTDDTCQKVEKTISKMKNFRLIKNPHGGKAITVMTGMLKAQGEIAVFTDMDQATPISEIEKLFPKFDEGFDIVIGSRSGRKGAPLVRKIVAWGFATTRTLILGLPFKDTQCGFKAMNKSSREQIFSALLPKWQKQVHSQAAVNAGWDVEFLYIGKKQGFRIAEVTVDWHHVGTERVQVVSDSIQALKDLLRIRFESK